MSLPLRLAAGALLAAALLSPIPAPLPAQPAGTVFESRGASRTAAAEAPPAVAREFRGVWVASVANIDWPSRPGLSTWEQQSELVAILDRAAALRLNAVVFQVRPAADALYASRHEPWSEFLTGTQGRAPEPFWDPLAFAVAEAHRRGLELHAWFNPFRAKHPTSTGPLARTHVSALHPEIVRSYGKHLWLDPGDAATRRHSLRVILDVVRRYDVDGVHIDDYFYPYKERDSTGQVIDFPDSATYARYRRAGGTLGRDDWRRQNVDRFVREMYRAVKAAKPWVKVGISPFGIWRPGHPATVTGFDAYAEIYADARKWLTNGWLDYFTPQLYWPIAAPGQSYPTLLDWWIQENVHGRHIWPGNFTSRVASTGTPSWRAQELLDQIAATRARPGATGNVHFSMRALVPGRDSLVERLLVEVYQAPALVPRTPWLDRTAPARPLVRVQTDSATGGALVTFRPGGKERVRLWIVRARTEGVWTTTILPGTERRHLLTTTPAAPRPDRVVVTAVDRMGNESS